MLYLEDYIEMIEHLPRELRDGFTEMREIDLQVHNSTDSLDERVRTFFGNARKMRVQERDTEFEAIRSAYHKTLEECDEKVEIAEQMYNLVDRYLRRLDQELHKFKLELEADNAGITQLLERRSLEMDPASARAATGSTRTHHLAPAGGVNGAADWQKENRCYDIHSAVPRRHNDRKSMLTGRRDERDRERGVTSLVGGGATRHLSSNHNGHHHHHHHQSLSATPLSMTSSAAAAASSSFGQLAPSSGGSGNSALMAAASQAIAATQHIQQGRRTTSSSGATTSSGSGSSSGFKTGYSGHDWLSSSSAAAAAAAGDGVFGSGSGGGGGVSDSGSVCHQQLQLSSSSSSLAAAGEYPVVARELAGAAHAALLSSGLAVAGSDKRKRKSTSARPVSVSPCPSDDFHPPHSSHHYHHQQQQQQQQLLDDMMLDESGADGSLAATSGSAVAPGSGAGAEDDQWLYDSSEPRYCICQNVSYGDMVACDNRECPYEWFHYPCVGITAPPKGKWYCPQCSVTMKRRRQK